MSLAWKRAVLDRDGACVLWHLDCEGDLHAHHVVTQQHLRKRGLTQHAWDRRIGVTVCERGHRRHHAATERICVDFLPAEVVAFVTELGLDWYLERYYQPSANPEAPEPSSSAPTGVSPSRRFGRNSGAKPRLRDRNADRRFYK